jgi:hypothetical protein
VPADAFRAVARHQPDDQRSGDRDQHFEQPEAVAGRRNQRGAEPAEEEQVREQTDQPQQAHGDEGTQHTDRNAQGLNRDHSRTSCEISKLMRHPSPSSERLSAGEQSVQHPQQFGRFRFQLRVVPEY